MMMVIEMKGCLIEAAVNNPYPCKMVKKTL